MLKDIFIDNNIASKFSNPQDVEYIKITKWLLFFNEKIAKTDKDKNARLVVSKKLLGEYYRSAQNANSNTSIPVIIDKLTREGRLINIKNDEIKAFKKQHYTKATERKLKCNAEDREHLPLVFLSNRKYALSLDENFLYDLLNFPGFAVTAAKRPENLPYAE